MKINELVEKTGLTAPTIRYYETMGLLDARHVQRRENNYRDYYDKAVAHLLIIKEAQAAGFTLAEFKMLDELCNLSEQAPQKVSFYLCQKLAEIQQKIVELEHMQDYLTQKLTEVEQKEAVSL